MSSWNDPTELPHKRANKHTAAQVVAKAQLVPLEPELLRAMFAATRRRRRSNECGLTETRRFPPPWLIEESSACFIVRDHNKQAHAVA
jgi:hypothetical protein